MKKIVIITAFLFLAVSCRTFNDTRYFAPEVNFSDSAYSADADGKGLDVTITLSKPAQKAFSIDFSVTGSLEEGRQFKVESKRVSVTEGASSAKFHISLFADEIWDETSQLVLSILPGEYYTVRPKGICQSTVTVHKAITLPVVRIIAPSDRYETNPFLAESFDFSIESSKPASNDIAVDLAMDGLVAGVDYSIGGSSSVILPAGNVKAQFTLNILKKDESGYDRTTSLAVVTKKGEYVAGGDACIFRLYDPVVNFKPLWKTYALNNGKGYQIRQAILNSSGEWKGNTALDMSESSEGSNYLRTYRNTFLSPWLCDIVSPGSNALRLTEMFPSLQYPNEECILDYAAAGNSRNFSPVDSLMRFVLDPSSSTQGAIVGEGRTFTAVYGIRSEWEEGENPYKAWQLDSKVTGCNIFASDHKAIKGRITVDLIKIEGRFNLTDLKETMLFSAWLKCDSPAFMKDVSPSDIGAVKDGDLWRVDYKLWPR